VKPDPEKLLRKREVIRKSLRGLEELRAGGREAFLASPILQDAALRRLQVAIEAMIDAAYHIVAREELGVPREYKDSFEILIEHGILPAEHRKTFTEMAKFRNRIVHLYEDVEPAEVADILENHLGDFDLFLEAIARRYFPRSDQGRPS